MGNTIDKKIGPMVDCLYFLKCGADTVHCNSKDNIPTARPDSGCTNNCLEYTPLDSIKLRRKN